MENNQGCCGLPFQCSAKDGRCKAREEWLRAQNRTEIGSPVNYNPDPTQPKETREERRARIKKQVLRQQARERAEERALERVQRERRQRGYDLGRTR